jgi:parallel beta-helix repeat protein
MPRAAKPRNHPRRHARFNARRRAFVVIASVGALGASGVTWLANSSNATPSAEGTEAHIATPYVAPDVAESDYAVPAGAIFVAPQGGVRAAAASRANGSAAAPYASMSDALSRSKNGGTIVVRGGTYRMSLGTISRRVTIQAYPHEKVWFNGAAVLANMARVGNVWVRTGWSPHICHTCYPHAALDPHFPYAGLTDQVFFDGVPQTEVGSLGSVRAGTFYDDTRAGRLYVGSNPTGHHVEATMYEKALQFGGRASGSSVRGIGFEHYAPHYNMDVPAMVTSNATNITFDRDTFALSAGRGLSIFRPGNVVTNSSFVDNGLNGLHANTADGLIVKNNRILGSNFEHWSIEPTATASIAAAKITSTNNGVISNNVVVGNDANGIWLDISSTHFAVADNNVVGNSGMGFAIEISAYVIVAGNVASGNGRVGIKVSGSNNISVWDNTAANNGWSQIGVYEDPRSNPHPTNGATWNTAQVSIVNNVIIGRSGATKSVLDSFDANHPARTTTLRMINADDRNVWGRPVPSSPRLMASWQDPRSKSAFATLAALQAGTGRERHSVNADRRSLNAMFVNVARGDYRIALGSAANVLGMSIPKPIAAAMGINPGIPTHLGALTVPAL